MKPRIFIIVLFYVVYIVIFGCDTGGGGNAGAIAIYPFGLVPLPKDSVRIWGRIFLEKDNGDIKGYVSDAEIHVWYYPCNRFEDESCEPPFQQDVDYYAINSNASGYYYIDIESELIEGGDRVIVSIDRYGHGTCDISASDGVDVDQLLKQTVVQLDFFVQPDCDGGG
ncbi:hypothetical protein K8I61_01020 [bacterium]|nr:hypothetical protein [bacterium]